MNWAVFRTRWRGCTGKLKGGKVYCGFTPSVIACGDATFPKGTASVATGTFISTTKGVPLRADFPRPGEDVTAGDKKGNLSRSD